MAISGGMIAAIAGALGVGGYVLYQHRKNAGGPSQCQKIVAGAASMAGTPTSDLLTKSVCDAAGSILDKGPGAIFDLPGPKIAGQVASYANNAINKIRGRHQQCENKSPCPANSKAADHSAVAGLIKQFALPTSVNGINVCGVCLDATGKKVVALQLENQAQSRLWSSSGPPKSPLQLLGVTSSLSSFSKVTTSGDTAGHTRDGQQATSSATTPANATSSGGLLVTSTPRK